MTRREFSKSVKRDAAARANGKCEACGARLAYGQFHFDHDLPDAMGGEPTLANCRVLCRTCHALKTTRVDVPTIAKSNRVRDRAQGIVRMKRPWPKRKVQWWRPFQPRQHNTKGETPNGD